MSRSGSTTTAPPRAAGTAKAPEKELAPRRGRPPKNPLPHPSPAPGKGLSDEQIEECLQRYLREQDRYIKLAEVVYEKCLDIVQKKLTIRATVQRRTKNLHSFVEKLKKEPQRSKYRSVDEVFAGISDLAGVRIATYLESDREIVVKEITNAFDFREPQAKAVEVKDRNGTEGRHYRATHCQIYLPEDDLTGNNENLRHSTCEIQVCSLLAHVFNEIEHDLQYKPLSGELSDAERQYLDQLGLNTRASDITIKLLLAENEKRLRARTTDQQEFGDVFDFVAHMRNTFNLPNGFSAYAGQLFDELIALRLISPDAIRREIEGTSNKRLVKICREEYARLKSHPNLPDNVTLEDDSSDLLLAGLLTARCDDIVKNHPVGRGLGRPSRLAQIARAYQQMKNSSR